MCGVTMYLNTQAFFFGYLDSDKTGYTYRANITSFAKLAVLSSNLSLCDVVP